MPAEPLSAKLLDDAERYAGCVPAGVSDRQRQAALLITDLERRLAGRADVLDELASIYPGDIDGSIRADIPATPPAPAAADGVARELLAGLKEMVRLADMGLEESLKEPEESGNFAAYSKAKSLIARYEPALTAALAPSELVNGAYKLEPAPAAAVVNEEMDKAIEVLARNMAVASGQNPDIGDMSKHRMWARNGVKAALPYLTAALAQQAPSGGAGVPDGWRVAMVMANPCAQKVHRDEPFFILLGRDKHAAAATREWARLREAERGVSPKTTDAFGIADAMDAFAASPATTEQG